MSTRSTTKFAYGAPGANTKPEAIVYKHSDGYPDAMAPTFLEFFQACETETEQDEHGHGGMSGTRFNDANYLAAKWVVFLARMYSTPFAYDEKAGSYRQIEESDKVGSLDFLSVGVVMQDPGDIEYTYWVDCSTGPEPVGRNRRPKVYIKKVGPYSHDWKPLDLSTKVGGGTR